VTSGTHSPTLKKPICMAFVDKAVQIDDEILVKNNKREMVGKVIKMPFIKHTYYKN
jgi:glycine cleavage system aminomethyltransferase T